MPIRKECPLEGYTDCFFEVADKWTRGDFRAYWNQGGDEFFAVYRRKITKLHLTVEEGEPITAPAELVDARIDGVDYVLWRWFGMAFAEAVVEAQRLGEAKAQQSSPTSAAKNGSA
jgi:hypothetical protein